MSFYKKYKKAFIAVFISISVLLVNSSGAQNDMAQVDSVETVDTTMMKETAVEMKSDTADALQKQPDWYNIKRYNIAGSLTYSLTDIKMNDNLKEVGTDYSGLNQKLSYLLMGTNSGWDLSNLADLSFSTWKKRLIVDTFRLEAVKGDVTINAGDFYPSYSSITLEGLTVRGLGFKKVFNERLIIQAFVAQSQQAIEPIKEDRNGNSIIDPGEDSNGNNILDVKEGDFSQHMAAIRVENKFNRFFDAGANIISAKDDMSSIPNPQSVDSTSSLYPVLKNDIIGIDGHFHFLDDRLKIDSEYGESKYRKGDKDTTFTDQASNIKINYLTKIWLTKMIYQKVDPNYHSEGNPYLETDKKGYDFENEFILSKKYSLVGNFEKYNDNVNKSDIETTTVTRIQEYKFKYYPESGNTEFKYKNTTKNGNRPDEKDTNDDTYAVTIRDEYSEETWVTYNVQYSKYKDNLLNTNDYSGYSGYVSWNWGIKKDRLSLLPYFNYNYFKYKNLGQKQIYYLANIQSNIVLWKDKCVLIPYLEYDYTSQNGVKVLERFSRDIESKFYISQNVSFSLKYSILDNNDENDSLDYFIRKIGGEVTAVF
ncbi:MAG: hypothetical protein PHX78_00720 [bacterium]|nr:hypothetical protein [bacterium]